MKGAWLIIIDAIVAIALTLLSGFVDSTPFGFTGGLWRGLPVAWITQAVALPPPYYKGPLQIDYGALVSDIIFWFFAALLVSEIIRQRKEKTEPREKTR